MNHPPVPAPSLARGSEPPLRVRLRASAHHSARALGLVWRSAPGGVVVLAVFTVIAAALPPFVAYVGKLIIDAVLAAHAALPNPTRAVKLVALELGAVVALAGAARKLTYLEYVLANDEHAKEVKLFGLGPLLLGRYRSMAETFFTEDKRLATRRAAWGYGLSLISTAVFYGCYALIVVAAVRGQLT